MWLGANKVSSNASSIVDGLKTVNKNVNFLLIIDKTYLP
jgi:hypothetical protein